LKLEPLFYKVRYLHTVRRAFLMFFEILFFKDEGCSELGCHINKRQEKHNTQKTSKYSLCHDIQKQSRKVFKRPCK